jgi:hypothetical protein
MNDAGSIDAGSKSIDATSTGDSSLGTVTSNPCPAGSPCKVLPFGDSITFGPIYAGAYRVELFHEAHTAGNNITFVGSETNGPATVDGVTFPQNHEGWYGWAIDPYSGRSGISSRVATVMPTYQPHIVLLMIGTNDAIDDHDMANAPTRLGNLIDSIYAQLPSVLIVVAQIIPSQDDALNGRIQTFNAAIPAVVQARRSAGKNIAMVDLYSVFASVIDYKTSMLGDTWHPTEAGYLPMGAAWYKAIASVLR